MSGPAGQRAHLILLHGGGVGPWMWRPIARELGDEVTVHTPTLPGHTPDGRGRFRDHDSAVACVAEQVGLDSLAGEVTVVGFSLGGQTAIRLAERFPSRVHRLGVVSSLLRPQRGAALTAGLAALATPLARNPKFAQAQARELLLPDELFPAYLEQSVHTHRDTLREVLRANLSFVAPEQVLVHPRPTRFWWGGREPGAVRSGMSAAVAAHPNVEAITWPEGRHGIMFQDPARFAAELRTLLAR